MIRSTALLDDLSPYGSVAFDIAPDHRLVALAQNESAMPPSPHVVRAVQAAISTEHLYPDPDWTDLRSAISEVHGILADGILCGAGSMELIRCLAQSFAGPGDEILSTAYGYAYFSVAARMVGATYVAAPEDKNFRVDVDALLAAVTARTRIVFIANPGNPTGTLLSASEVERLRDGLRPDILLVVDEAYGEMADPTGKGMLAMVSRGDTVVLRTFSKAYALAGARVGWGLFPSGVAAEVRKVLPPGNVSGIAQAAAAAAVRDQAYMHAVRKATIATRTRLLAALADMGLGTTESETNFVLIWFESEDAATAADAALRAKGVVLRSMAGYGIAHCLRATVGTDEDTEFATQILGNWACRSHA